MRHKHGNTQTSLVTLSTLLLATAAINSAQAGAWVPKQGEGYNKVGYAFYEADEFEGDNPEFGKFEGTNISYYGEYGLGSQWAVYGSLLYQELEQTAANGTVTEGAGFSDVELGVRKQWTDGPYVIATSFLVKLPYLYDENDELPTGNGQEDYEVKVLLGKSLNQYGYFGAELGYRLRTDSPSDEIRYLLEYGFSAGDNLYFRTKLDGTKSAKNGDDAGATNTNLSITPEFDVGKWELTSGWNFDKQGPFKHWGIEVTYTQEIYGETTLLGDSVQFGITKVY